MGATITAYRGVRAQTEKRAIRSVRAGYSWTVNRERAVWFAKRFEGIHGKAFVAEAHIPRDAILAGNTATFITMIYLIAAPIGNLFDSI